MSDISLHFLVLKINLTFNTITGRKTKLSIKNIIWYDLLFLGFYFHSIFQEITLMAFFEYNI